jgi:hypothetical protein
MRGMSKGIDCLWLRFSEFITLYAFCRLALADGVANLKSYSWKSTASSSHSATRQSVEAQLDEEMQQTKDFVQQLLQSNKQIQQGYQAIQYTMMQVIISTFTICQISIVSKTDELMINK